MASGPSLMDSLFQRSLEDLIKGLRVHQPGGEAAFISKILEEIRREIKSTDPQVKSTALQKLTYIHSLHGHDMSWAAFHAVEVTSSHNFQQKKIGYLAASLSFHSSTDVLLLLTNQLRKDLSSANQFEVSLALECISNICTPDLASDLTPDIFTLLGSSKQLVKKKAIGTVLRIFQEYPDAVRVCFKRLVENLESSDVGTVSTVVSVFCELALREPKSYLPLAPEFYRILVDSRNNWLLIKVLKVFAKLASLEPRLANKIVEPVCDHMKRNGAVSLVFECVRTTVSSLGNYESAVKLAVEKIREFLVDDDPNLKYLGLQALSIVAPKHLWAVLENKEAVIRSLSDIDPNIKVEALRLVMSMVSEDNVAEICRVLINYALKSDPEFCNEILGSILSACCKNVYEIIVDFDWYVALLGEMATIPHCQKGEEIEYQLIDIGMRVKDARPELVRVGRDLLIDPALLGNPFIHRILSAAAWVSGEYVDFVKDLFELMEALLQPRTSLLPPSIRAVYIQSAFKVLASCLHYYFFPNEAVASSPCCYDFKPGLLDSVSEREYPESTDCVSRRTPAESELVEGFSPRGSSQSIDCLPLNQVEDAFVTQGLTSSSASARRDGFTKQSILNLLNLIEEAVGPLARSHEVELQERVGNILGLIELIKAELSVHVVRKEGAVETKEFNCSEIINLLHEVFSDELGPVAVNAQERVPKLEESMLKENLIDLEEICGVIQLHISTSFSLRRPQSEERDSVPPFDCQTIEVSETVTESKSLLAEHRKKHGLYYLSSEKKEVLSNDYPPANDLRQQDNANDDAEDLVKLTEKSLTLKWRPNQAKPRPVVIKLDDVDGIPTAATKLEPKVDLISGAVRDVLFGNEAIPSSSMTKLSDNSSSSKRRGKEKSVVGQTFELKENQAGEGKSELENSNSRRSKHHNHHKERKHRSSGKNAEKREENNQKDKQKNGHRHSRHKTRHRADGAVNVVAQTPVIPDFLL